MRLIKFVHFLIQMGLSIRFTGFVFMFIMGLQLTDAQHVIVFDESIEEPVERVALFNQDKSVSILTDNFGKADIQAFAENDSIYFQHPTYELIGFRKHELVYGNSRVLLKKKNILMEEFIISASKVKESKINYIIIN